MEAPTPRNDGPASDEGAGLDFRAVFEAIPGLYIVLRADTPRFTIVAVSDAFLRAVMAEREGIVGRGVFEAFPDPPGDPTATGTRHLRASLERAVVTGMPDAMAVQPYPVRRADGSWEERLWKPLNTPFADPATGRVTHIIHRAEDVTEVVGLAAANDRLRGDHADSQRALRGAEHSNAELARESVELEGANRRLQELAAELAARTGEADAARRVAERERARTEGILEAMSDAYVLLDHDFRFSAVNAAAERMLGHRRGDLLGRTHWEVFPESTDAETGRAYRRVVERGEEAHFTTHYAGDGFDSDVVIDAYPTIERGVAVFWRDITAQLRGEADLRASETRYRTLFDSLDEGFCVIEMLYDAAGRPVDYRFVETNPAFVAQTGLTDAVGKTVLELVPGQEAHWFEMYGRVVATGEAVRFQNIAEGLGRYYNVYAFRLGPAEDRSVAVLFQDVSAERRAERERERLLGELELERARLEEVFRRAPSFIVAYRGPENVFEFVNEAYYQLVGHREVLGKPLLEALPEVRGQGFEPILEQVRITGEPWVGHEVPVQLQRSPGAPLETRYITTVFQALTEATGERSGVVAHGSDVTEQVLARREVERLLAESERARGEAEAARADAESANRAKSEFLAVMSHELRTPLNAIGGYVELLEMGIRGPVNDVQREDLHRIQKSQRHLLGLINEVLNYAKLETGTVQFDIDNVPLRDAVAAAELLVAPQALGKGLTLLVRDAPESLAARGDAEKLRQILVNLLSNAVKFTDAGGRIDVSCALEGAWVRVRVTDTGIGIPADKVEAIFDPFVQVRAGLTRQHEGTGLGLAISRDLARGMGGDITAASTLGEGSTFTLTLVAA